MKSKNVAAEVMKHALKEYIEKIGATNFIMMQKFSERFKQIAENYNERTSIADIEQMLEKQKNRRVIKGGWRIFDTSECQ